jgi:hypothetical protein
MVLEKFPNPNRIRWAIWGICVSILVALLCRVRWGESIAIPCWIKWLTGIPCPMCGMTRSLTALLQGDFERSMSFHGLGIVMLGGLLSTLLLVSAELLLGRTMVFTRCDRTLKKTIAFSVISLFLIHHGIRLVPLVRSGELAASISDSVIGRLLLH